MIFFMNTVVVGNDNLYLLKEFIASLGEAGKTFRYFDTRDLTVLKNHLATLLFVGEDGTALAYGHLDKDGERVWVGIAVLPFAQGKSIGSKMMASLFNESDRLKITQLTAAVDEDNKASQALFKKFGFTLEEIKLGICYYVFNRV